AEWEARVAQLARHELRLPDGEIGGDGDEFTFRRLIRNRCPRVGADGLGIAILQIAAAVATADDVGLELGVAAGTVADHHAAIALTSRPSSSVGSGRIAIGRV